MTEYYFVDQNGRKSSDHHIFFEEYPKIKLGQQQYEKKTIPGKGNVYYATGTYSDTEIKMTVDVNVVGSETERMAAYIDARNFLLACGTLCFCDAPEYYYKIQHIDLGTVAQYTEEAGDFEISIICKPGAYRNDGSLEYAADEVLQNPYSECHPEYRITGEGICELIVNGKMMRANVGQNLVINTDLMLAYRTDGIMQNMEVTGEYSDLYLKSGENTITITEGFDLKIIPNWRCL